MSVRKILDDLAQNLEHEIESGTRHARVSPEVMAALKTPNAPSDKPSREPPPPVVAGAPGLREVPTPERIADAAEGLAAIAREVAACTRCPLHESRKNTVPGQGAARPQIVFVGEGPGADEDAQGLAFVGRAGQLLTKMIEAMGYTRDEVFICNVVKCRPPGNRTPELSEMTACVPYLKRQLTLLHPQVIVALGGTALNGLIELPKGTGITRLRGTWMSLDGIDLMPTFHPAYLLRNPNMKKYVWEDLKTVLRKLGRPIPEVRR